MNVEPLDSLSEEEMRQLLLKRKAEKAAMPPQYGFVDESVGIPKGRFNPGQYAPTYGAEQVGISADYYDNAAGSMPYVDRQFKTHEEAGQGTLDVPAILKTGLASKGAEHYSRMVIDRLMNPGRNIPKAHPTLEPLSLIHI